MDAPAHETAAFASGPVMRCNAMDLSRVRPALLFATSVEAVKSKDPIEGPPAVCTGAIARYGQFPPSKGGGPIEASNPRPPRARSEVVSTLERGWPH